MPDNFDEASAATKELFEADSSGEKATEENAAGEEAASSAPDEDTAAEATEAAEAAETAAELAAEKDGELKQAMEENEALRQRIGELMEAIGELSERNAGKTVEEALMPPTLDIAELSKADSEAQREAMAKFARDMSEYNRQELLKELAPTLEYARRGMAEAEKADTIELLSNVPELSGIRDIVPDLDRIIANNKWLQSEDMPADERYINAFAIARGIDSINSPKKDGEKRELTADELMGIYDNNPEFREMIERKRLEAVKNGQKVPVLSASNGAAGAALDIKEKPQTIEEASERTRKLFGL